jgi:DNA-binding PadR family transcriptional regulator
LEVFNMSLRFALLGLLEDGPASGYALTTRFDRSLRRYAWSAQQSHIYPELNRLAAESLIEVVEEGPRGRRTYALTETGRATLREWLLSEPKPRAIRDEQALRHMLLSALEPGEARVKLEAALAEATATIAELRATADAADAGTHPRGRLRFGRLALELGIYQAEATEAWARWALSELDSTPSPGDGQ